MRDHDITKLGSLVKAETRLLLENVRLLDLVSLDWLQRFLLVVAKGVLEAVVEVWKEVLLSAAEELARECPSCGGRRKWKWRRKQTMKLSVLGLGFELPKPYVECGHCDAPGLSVMKTLTGLRSGDTSTELDLLTARRAAQDTYGKASREMKAHHGQDIERTKVRRKALGVEEEATIFADEFRGRAEAATLPAVGAHSLLAEADGGSNRTGVLVPCQKGDAGFGKTTAKRGMPRRKMVIQKREMITMDIRAPGEMEPRALEVMVPFVSKPGERARRMRTMAIRAGMGTNTDVRGLGDMGSGLAGAFGNAFPDHPGFWAADWTHVKNYVTAATTVLVDFSDIDRWTEQMLDALWHRCKSMCEHLLAEAYGYRVHPLPKEVEKCPLHALQTYIGNNWEHFRFKQMKDEGWPFISARAENQVRERIRKRFGGPGTWKVENLEPKAILLLIIDEGSWGQFCGWLHLRRSTEYRRQLFSRLQKAVQQGRLSSAVLSMAYEPLGPPSSEEKRRDEEPQQTKAMAA